MNNSEIIELTEKYLEGRRIPFVWPGTIDRVNRVKDVIYMQNSSISQFKLEAKLS